MDSDHDWVTTTITAALIRGALDLEATERGVLPHRLPAWARKQIPDDQLAMAEAQPSGVRLAFRTTATAIELDVLPTKLAYVGAPPRPDGIYDLVVDGQLVDRGSVTGGHVRLIDMQTGAVEIQPGEPSTLRFDGSGRRCQGRRGLAAAQRGHRAGRAANERARRGAA